MYSHKVYYDTPADVPKLICIPAVLNPIMGFVGGRITQGVPCSNEQTKS